MVDRDLGTPGPEVVEQKQLSHSERVEQFFHELRGMPVGRKILEQYATNGAVPLDYLLASEVAKSLTMMPAELMNYLLGKAKTEYHQDHREELDKFKSVVDNPLLSDALLVLNETRRFIGMDMRGQKIGIGEHRVAIDHRSYGGSFAEGELNPQDLEGTKMPTEIQEALKLWQEQGGKVEVSLSSDIGGMDEINPLGDSEATILFSAQMPDRSTWGSIHLELTFHPNRGGIDTEIGIAGQFAFGPLRNWVDDKLNRWGNPGMNRNDLLPERLHTFAQTLLGIEESIAKN